MGGDVGRTAGMAMVPKNEGVDDTAEVDGKSVARGEVEGAADTLSDGTVLVQAGTVQAQEHSGPPRAVS